MKTGLVLEGGGLRGFYTIGVLDCFMDNGISFDYVVGVSAGACNGASYVSGQKGRSYRVIYEFMDDPRYLGIRSFIKTGSVFGMDFIFDEIPNKHVYFDREASFTSLTEFYTGVGDVETGKAVYFGKEAHRNDFTVLRASSSMPLFSPFVEYEGRKYLDGGTFDPIPVKKAIEDGCEKIVVVLTRHLGYIKKPETMRAAYKYALRKYPQTVAAMDRRHEVYNESTALVKRLEEEGCAVVIAPSAPLKLGRFDKNKKRINDSYNLGISDANKLLSKVKNHLA